MPIVVTHRVARCVIARRFAPLLLVLLVLPGLTGCVTNPATGKLVLNTMSEEKEIALGTEAQVEFLNTNGGNIPDDQLLAYVRNLGQELAAVSERPELPWEFHVLDSGQINAFALPGGKVFMSRGLMERMTNEAQLAGVLGHEIGHVTSMHVGRRISQQQLIGIAGFGLSIAGGFGDNDWLRAAGLGVMAGGSLVYLPSFSRGNESEADALGVRYMSRLGYNPYGQVEVMQILKEASGGGSGNLLENMLATHPLPQDRIDDLEELIREEYPEAGSYGTYDFREDAFERNVLARLQRLPAPKHSPSEAAKAAILRAYAEHMLAGGCAHEGHDHGTHGS